VRCFATNQHPTIARLRDSFTEFTEYFANAKSQVRVRRHAVDLCKTVIDSLIPEAIIEYGEANLRSAGESAV
jgi:hypothetical protein